MRDKRIYGRSRPCHSRFATTGRTRPCCATATARANAASSSRASAFVPKTIADGKRQILSIHIPGDLPDLQNLHLATMDHDLVALSNCTLAFIAHTTIKELIRIRPTVGDIFWRDTLVDAAVFREWIVNVGQRAAHNRLAHIIVELRERLRMIGRVTGNAFAMPLTQEQIGEAMGVTSVHTNRILRQLRLDGVLEFHRGMVRILNEHKLQELAQFDARYLHSSPSI
jgi:CRP-like cAMP-binding protein